MDINQVCNQIVDYCMGNKNYHMDTTSKKKVSAKLQSTIEENRLSFKIENLDIQYESSEPSSYPYFYGDVVLQYTYLYLDEVQH